MNIDSKFLSLDDKTMIKNELTVSVKSDYGITKKYMVYRSGISEYILPLVWSKNNLSYFPEPVFENTKINIKTSSITLRPSQMECIKKCDEEFTKNFGGGIINMQTGSGKTVCSLYIIGKYKLKTLIIVNTVELMNQWIKSIKMFLPDASIGKIQGNTFDIYEKDIVIGMIQTISMRKEYTREKLSVFCLLFVDECHHLSSEVFSEALIKTRVKYTFGLSATIERKDGLECVFKWHIGDIIFSDSNGVKKQKTEFIKLDYTGESSKELFMYNGKPKISTMITNISEDITRTKMICDYLLTLDESRRVLILSDRVSQLTKMHKILGNKLSGLFTGKTSEIEKNSTRKKMFMLATYQLASEGFDHPVLNTLLFATPRSSVRQAIGRIYRKQHQSPPIIIDVVDWFSVFPYQYKKRKTIYNTDISTKDVIEDVCLFD
jgi:superfamily II DNA or RNA helicase